MNTEQGSIVVRQEEPTSTALLSQNVRVVGSYRPPVKLLMRWLTDGSVLSVSSVNGIDVEPMEGWLARSFRDQLKNCPDLIAAIESAYEGQTQTVTALLGEMLVDILVAPDRDASGQIASVIGVITDASERIAALRAVRVIELLGDLRSGLSRAVNEHEYIQTCCQILESLYPATWIGLDEQDERKSLRTYVGRSAQAKLLKDVNLSWDEKALNGRHVPGEAMRTSKTRADSNLRLSRDAPSYSGWADRWTYIVSVPLIHHGSALGVMTIHSDDSLIADDEVIKIWEQIAEDISEGINLLRVRQQEQLTRAQGEGKGEQYRKVLDNMFDVVVVHRNGKLLDINPAGVGLFKADSADDLVGSNFLTLVVPGDRKMVAERILNSVSSVPANSQVLSEIRLQALSGEIVEVEGLTYETKHEGIPALQSVFRDITERKRANADLARLVDNMEYAQQFAMMGSAEVDLASEKTEWSRGAMDIVGYDPNSATLPFLDAMKDVLSVVDHDAVTKMYWLLVSSGKPASMEISVQARGDMKERLVLLHGRPHVDGRSRVSKLLFVMQDGTSHTRKLRKAQAESEKLSSVVESTNTGFIEVVFTGPAVLAASDQREGLVAMSSAAVEMLTSGVPQPITISLEKFLSFFSSEDRRVLNTWFTQGEGQTRGFEHEVKLSSASESRWLRVVGTQTKDGWLLALSDTTNENRLREEKDNLQRSLSLTKTVARMVEWTFDIKREMVLWGPDVEAFVGHPVPLEGLTYNGFMASIREVDRPLIREAVNNSIQHGVPGEMVYIQKFHRSPPIRLYGRWVPEIDEHKQVTKLRGVSIDVSRMKTPPVGEEDERIDRKSGLPTQVALQERLRYLTETQADVAAFSLIGIRMPAYRETKTVVPEEATFYQMLRNFVTQLQCVLSNMDTFGRFEPGAFLIIRRQATNDADKITVKQTIESIIAMTLEASNAKSIASAECEVVSQSVADADGNMRMAFQKLRNWALNNRS